MNLRSLIQRGASPKLVAGHNLSGFSLALPGTGVNWRVEAGPFEANATVAICLGKIVGKVQQARLAIRSQGEDGALNFRFDDGSEEDWQFHQQIFASTANPFFRAIIQSMRDLLHQLWENALALPDFAEASYPFHRTMYEAIARRNPKKARAEAWKLIDSVEREIREAFPNEV